MSDFRFEWDDPKNNENFYKHGVWFEEAVAVFFDLRAMLLGDEQPTGDERFLLIGLAPSLRTLVVCHCYREEGAVIRIISACERPTQGARSAHSEGPSHIEATVRLRSAAKTPPRCALRLPATRSERVAYERRWL